MTVLEKKYLERTNNPDPRRMVWAQIRAYEEQLSKIRRRAHREQQIQEDAYRQLRERQEPRTSKASP